MRSIFSWFTSFPEEPFNSFRMVSTSFLFENWEGEKSLNKVILVGLDISLQISDSEESALHLFLIYIISRRANQFL